MLNLDYPNLNSMELSDSFTSNILVYLSVRTLDCLDYFHVPDKVWDTRDLRFEWSTPKNIMSSHNYIYGVNLFSFVNL